MFAISKRHKFLRDSCCCQFVPYTFDKIRFNNEKLRCPKMAYLFFKKTTAQSVTASFFSTFYVLIYNSIFFFISQWKSLPVFLRVIRYSLFSESLNHKKGLWKFFLYMLVSEGISMPSLKKIRDVSQRPLFNLNLNYEKIYLFCLHYKSTT